MSLPEVRNDLSLKDVATSTEGIIWSSANYLRQTKSNTHVIYYIVK